MKTTTSRATRAVLNERAIIAQWRGVASHPIHPLPPPKYKFNVTPFLIGCCVCFISRWSAGILSDQSETFKIFGMRMVNFN